MTSTRTYNVYDLNSMSANIPEQAELPADYQHAVEETIAVNAESWMIAFGRLPVVDEDFRLEAV